MDGFANAFIRAATAEVAVHGLRDLIVAGVRSLGQQCGCGHDLSGLAIAALRDFFVDPSLLKDVQAVGAQAFDGGDVLA